MKLLIVLLFIVFITGCKERNNNPVYAAVINASGTFITEFVQSNLTLRIKGTTNIKKENDNTFYVAGYVEGFSSYNVPFSIEHFSETIQFAGGDINNQENWQCLEIYLGKKRIK